VAPIFTTMKPLETKSIKIGDNSYPLKKSARAYLKFEELSKHSINDFDSSTKDTINFLYSCFWGGGSRITLEEFLDLIDDENLTELADRFISIIVDKTDTKKKQIPR
jgi:hypothetical protein